MNDPKKVLALVTPEALASFPVLVTPKPTAEGAEPKYQLTLVFDKAAQQSPEFRALKAAAEKAAKDKWGTEMPRKLKSPFLTVDDLNNVPDGYDDDCVFIRTTSKNKPQVVGRDPSVKIDAAEVYPGMVVRASVRPYAWSHKTGGNGVSFGLGNVQIIRDGRRLGGSGAKPEEEFGALPESTGDDPFA